MESLDHSVCLGMVGSGHDAIYSPKCGKLSEECRRELGTSVCCYCGRNPELLDPSMSKCINDGLGCHVGEWNGYRPSREAVHGRQQVAETVRERKRHDIQVEMLEAFVRHFEVANWRNDMTSYFALLAREAFSRPSTDILSDRRPNEFGTEGLTSPFYAGLSKTMDGVEDAATEVERNVRPVRAITDIDLYNQYRWT